ncbi:MAG: hypothetical protein ABIG64_07035 [Candidatus Omnitrophota bacterium]
MKTLFILFSTMAILSANVVSGFCSDISPALMYEQENGEAVYYDKEKGGERARCEFKVTKELRKDKVIYKYNSHTSGDYCKYKNVSWDVTAEMEERDGFLYPLFSKKIIKSSDGKILEAHDKQFDYAANTLNIIITNEKGGIAKKKKYTLRGHTTDGDLLAYVLRAYAENIDKRTHKQFYLLSDKANLYKTTIQPKLGEEVTLPVGKMETIKMRLIPDLGMLQDAAEYLVPPTFVWFTKAPPHVLLQYEGLEADLGTAHIKTNLIKKEPSVE